jgi:hypothetical protein
MRGRALLQPQPSRAALDAVNLSVAALPMLLVDDKVHNMLHAILIRVVTMFEMAWVQRDFCAGHIVSA